MHTFVPGKFTRAELSNFERVIEDSEGNEYGVNMVGDVVDADGNYAGHFNGAVITEHAEPVYFTYLVTDAEAPEGLFRVPKKFVFKTGVKETALEKRQYLAPIGSGF